MMKWTNLLRRIEPFLDLLDARYLPLLAVVYCASGRHEP